MSPLVRTTRYSLSAVPNKALSFDSEGCFSTSHGYTILITTGRTVRTFREAIDIEEQRWKQVRQTLRPWDREALDWIFNAARQHGDAGTMCTSPRMIEVTMLFALIEIVKRLDVVEKKPSVLLRKQSVIFISEDNHQQPGGHRSPPLEHNDSTLCVHMQVS